MINQVITLIKKEFLIEMRQKYALSGMVLYLVSSLFIIYMALNLNNSTLHPVVWSAVFWIIILFTAANSVAKSFIQEKQGILLYFYTITNPTAIILSKILYHSFLMMMMIGLGAFLYSIFMGNPVQDVGVFLLVLFLAAIGFSAAFTMISSIASKAINSSTLMAILGFPIILPMLLLILKITKNSIDGLPADNSYDEILTLSAIIVITFTSSLLLFPYLWKSS